MIKFKSYWQSKTFWALLATAVIGGYKVIAPRYGLDDRWVEGAIYVLTALGIWGVRTANTSIGTPTAPIPEGPNNVVPVVPPALPSPGGDGSPQTNGNEGAASALQDQPGAAVQPLFGGGLAQLAALGMSPGVQDTLVTMLTQALNAGLPTSQVGPFLARLIGLLPVLPDLLDGSPYLSQRSRDRIAGLLSDLRIEAGL